MSSQVGAELKDDICAILKKHDGCLSLEEFWAVFNKEKGFSPPKRVRRNIGSQFADVVEVVTKQSGKKILHLKELATVTAPVRKVKQAKSAVVTAPVRQVNQAENAAVTDPGRRVKQAENAAVTDPVRQVKQTKNAAVSDPVRQVKQMKNAAVTDPVRQVKQEKNAAVTDLKRQVEQVLQDSGGQIRYDHFWDVFKATYHDLPEPTAVGLTAGSENWEFLSLVSDSWEDRYEGDIRYICWRTVRRKTVASAPSGQQLDADKWPSLQEAQSVQNVTPPPAVVKPDMAEHNRRVYYGRHPSPYRQQPRGPIEMRPVYAQNHTSPGTSYSPLTMQATKSKICVPKDQLESVAEDCIERLAESKEYVSTARIEKLLLQHYRAERLSDINNMRSIEQISVVNEHIRMQAKVNAYIQAFVKVRSIATVHELGEALKEFAPKDKGFEALHLGPLVKQPLVFQFFKLPEGTEVPDIDTGDILEYLRGYLTVNDAWTNKQTDLQDFMKYMMEARGLSNPYELGVRLRSIALACQVCTGPHSLIASCH